MAADPLEAKINKIRQQNEEIRRRYEEVEADKKNAAKSNALVQMVPSTDWPERKEPPEFSSPPVPKTPPKPRNSPRDHNGGSIQYRAGGEGKKIHTFPQNEGPPPDPKYNFLADSEREEHHDYSRDDKSKRGKPSRPNFKRRGGGREWQNQEFRGKSGASGPGKDSVPDYEAWRAERNKIDEARISRQRTAEGNWKREWDNDKMHLADDSRRENHTLGDTMQPPEVDRHPRGYPRGSAYSHVRESDHDRRIITSSDKNSQNPSRNPLMSVKVSSPNIVGTGRVGPRQRSRVMYSSQSEAESMNFEVGNFTVLQKSEEKPKSKDFGNSTKTFQRKNDPEKSRNERFHKDFNNRDFRNFQKSPVQRRHSSSNYQAKSPRDNRKFGRNCESMGSEITSFDVGSVCKEDKNEYEGNSNDDQASSSLIEEVFTQNIEESVEIVENTELKVQEFPKNTEKVEILNDSTSEKIIESQNSEDYESIESSGDQIINNDDIPLNLDEEIKEEIPNSIEIEEKQELNPVIDTKDLIHEDLIKTTDKAIILDDNNTPEEIKEEISSVEVDGNAEDSKKQ